ncbi:MAG TPA: type II toxin-antitoxin system VapC family toxin [Vicinamibacterales bacterium]|nr:type II toxin-antitoxin system VapC family toxin [Vicinamibacterales bacterium]
MTRPVLLDTSFLIALERETARPAAGRASAMLARLRSRRLMVSVVTVAEVLDGALDPRAALALLGRFSIQGIHLAQARRCALLQRRSATRLGENDAWLVATAQSLDADVVGCDRAAFERLGPRYLRFR